MPNPITGSDRPGCRHGPRAVVGKRRKGPLHLLVLLIGACDLSACTPTEPSFVGEVAVLNTDRRLIVERRDGTVAATDLDTGEKLWSLQPLPQPAPGFVTVPTRHLVCPIERTFAGTLLLRYHTRLVAVDGATGKRLWERKAVGWATEDLRCPWGAADSGALMLRGHGLFLQKLDTQGNDEWLFSMERLGPALGPGQVVTPSGDVLLRTRSFFVSVNPKGKLGWVEHR